jgi:fused signal recognition particle receptor
MGLFRKLKSGLSKTRTRLAGGIRSVLTLGRRIDEALLEELEEALLLGDVGPRVTSELLDATRGAWKKGALKQAEDVLPFLQAQVRTRLERGETELARAAAGPTVVLVCGVNGSGKTTSIGKLTAWLRREGHTVVLGASDTFRAAAVEQLTIWSRRNDVEIVKQATGADPAAVAFDAVAAAKARGRDYAIIDTAGRLHTQENLMQELGKIRRSVGKACEGAPHEVLLVVDATTGQNAVRQAQLFHEVASVTGLFVAKLDGTAKGGAVLGIQDAVGVPVKFIGVGESIEDIQPFDAGAFAEALFA